VCARFAWVCMCALVHACARACVRSCMHAFVHECANVCALASACDGGGALASRSTSAADCAERWDVPMTKISSGSEWLPALSALCPAPRAPPDSASGGARSLRHTWPKYRALRGGNQRLTRSVVSTQDATTGSLTWTMPRSTKSETGRSLGSSVSVYCKPDMLHIALDLEFERERKGPATMLFLKIGGR
jgi:hypothetical protein